MSILTPAIDHLLKDLPWVEDVRLVVGDLFSREMIKNDLLEKAKVIPSWSVTTIGGLAKEILSAAGKSEIKVLSFSSQADALQHLAKTEILLKKIPELCRHLKDRSVALKTARFLTELDRFYVTREDLSALVEVFREKDVGLGDFLECISGLWSSGFLNPWGDGSLIRLAFEVLREEGIFVPKVVYVSGFSEFTPLEEAFLARLKEVSDVHVIKPTQNETQNVLQFWRPHSPIDEFYFVQERLKNYSDAAIFLPDDVLYRRFFQEKCKEFKVPVSGLGLEQNWIDHPEWLWWRDTLRVISSGLKGSDVRSWLSLGEGRKELFEKAFRLGVDSGSSQWQKLQNKEIDLLISGVKIFSSKMNLTQFQEACIRFSNEVRKSERYVFAEASELLVEFSDHLISEREYLSEFCARLPAYLRLFEEFLESRGRMRSLVADQGLILSTHRLWLRNVKTAYVLGAGSLSRAQSSSDPWNWEIKEVKRAWKKIHFTQEILDDHLQHFLFGQSEQTILSAPEYDLAGKPSSAGPVFKQLFEERNEVSALTVKGGHANVGWTIQWKQANPLSPVTDISLIEKFLATKSLTVSQFEDYLRCPFLFYSRHVLKIKPPEELSLEPSSLSRGTLIHKALERILRDEIEKNKTYSLTEGRLRLREILKEELKADIVLGLYRHKPLIEKAEKIFQYALERWWDWEQDNRLKHPTLRPKFLEEPVEVEIKTGDRTLKLQGKIDRVDTDGKHAVIVDYKSGTPPFTGRELQEGIGSQLLLYAKGIEKKTGLLPVASYYLKVGKRIDWKKGLFVKDFNKILHTTHTSNSGLTPKLFGEIYEGVLSRWENALGSLISGKFDAKPSRPEKDCRTCAYRNICGFDPDADTEEGADNV